MRGHQNLWKPSSQGCGQSATSIIRRPVSRAIPPPLHLQTRRARCCGAWAACSCRLAVVAQLVAAVWPVPVERVLSAAMIAARCTSRLAAKGTDPKSAASIASARDPPSQPGDRSDRQRQGPEPAIHHRQGDTSPVPALAQLCGPCGYKAGCMPAPDRCRAGRSLDRGGPSTSAYRRHHASRRTGSSRLQTTDPRASTTHSPTRVYIDHRNRFRGPAQPNAVDRADSSAGLLQSF